MDIDIEAFKRFLIEEKRASHETVTAYCSDLKVFRSFIATLPDGETHEYEAAASFIASLQQSHTPSGVDRKVSSLRAFFMFCGIPKNKVSKAFVAADNRTSQVQTCIHIKPATVIIDEDILALITVGLRDCSLTGMRNQLMIIVLASSRMQIGDMLALSPDCIATSLDSTGSTIHTYVCSKHKKHTETVIRPCIYELLCAYRERLLHYRPTPEFLFPIFTAYGQRLMDRQSFMLMVRTLWTQTGIARPLCPNNIRHMTELRVLYDFLDEHKDKILHQSDLTPAHKARHGTLVPDQCMRDMYNTKHPRS